MARHYIIMADIISSRHIQDADFMGQFKTLTSLANEQFKRQIISPLTITLGDEFQGIVDNAQTLFKLLFFLEEQRIGAGYTFQLRYSLVHGEIETEINTKIAYEMYGTGLTKAREGLQIAKTSGHQHYVDLKSMPEAQLKLCLELYQSIKSDWKPREYKVVAAFLKHNDYKDLEKMGLYKTRSGAWKKGKSLRIEEYNTVKALIFLILKHG
ncbi:MAG: SatD family protein [Bacteroidota bacterium]